MRPDLRPVCDLHICNEADVHSNPTRREIREGDGGIFLSEATTERPGDTLPTEDSTVTLKKRPAQKSKPKGRPKFGMIWDYVAGKWVADAEKLVADRAEAAKKKKEREERGKPSIGRPRMTDAEKQAAAKQRDQAETKPR